MKIFTIKFKKKQKNIPIDFGDVTFSEGELTGSGGVVQLSDKESSLMQFFVNNNKTVIPEKSVVMGAWGEGTEEELEAYVGFLRQKLEYLKSEIKIFRINGLGYKICA